VAHGAEGIEFVVLELSPVSHMDAMGAAFMEELFMNYNTRGMQLVGVGMGWGGVGWCGVGSGQGRVGWVVGWGEGPGGPGAWHCWCV